MKKLVYLGFILLLSGCAINTPRYRSDEIIGSKEGLIAVEYFDMTHAKNLYKGDSDFSKIIAEYLAGALQEKDFKAVAVQRHDSNVPAKYRITGEITKIAPGSFSGRFWIGPGVGMARISAEAVLIRVSDNKELARKRVTLSSSALRGTETILRYISANVAWKISNNFIYVLKDDAIREAK